MGRCHKAKPVRGWLVLVSLQVGAWIVEAFGLLAVVVGVFAVIAHLSPLAFRASILTSILVVVFGFSGSFIGLIIYAVGQMKQERQQEEQGKTTPAASGDTPVQEKETTE